ncbi:MAG: DUF192 domain-containing protein [Erythrobacter sp.]|uniref:DUF192 domain-containing protein n=1 Tax=Erythrobacter sp. TaxID=1042 RepID=UPI0025EF2FB3|nr:DUF192 domain-containing protein [Erythrobacter sp.]MCL9999138.1 DUF192 domain-containing protein [Erythrobacter sp.]
MVRHILAAATLALALVACSPGTSATATAQAPAGAEAARHPVSGLKVIDLVVDRGGKKIAFKVELADTSEAQAKGLMFRTELGDFEGMIFPADVPQAKAFWMKNTPLSLDIIFIGTDGRVQNIAADTKPYSLDSVRSAGIASAVLELRAGRAKALGIVPGDLVTYTLPQ